MDRAAHAAADPLLVYLLRKQGVCWNMRSWLQELFERHGREVNRFLRRRGHTVEAADDLTHDAFLRVMLSAREQDVENPEPIFTRSRATSRSTWTGANDA